MSLSFVSAGTSFEVRWITYAMLRDNVQHHLEGGKPSGAFPVLHQIATALGGRPIQVPAAALGAEVERAAALLSRPIDELAVSARTLAVVSLNWPPEPMETRLAGSAFAEQWVPGPHRTLGDVFGNLVTQLRSLAQSAAAGASVEIIDT